VSWNGSDSGSNNKVGSAPRADRKPAPSFKKGIIAGLIVIIGAGLAAWWIGRPGTSAPTKEKKTATKQIAEVKPQIVTQAVEVAEQKVEEPKPVDPKARPTKIGETVNGYIKLPSGRLHKVSGVVTYNAAESQPKGRYEIFDYHCENEMAGLLSMEPGQSIVGTPRYNGRFTKEFLKSLETPIVINEDDSEEDKELKRNVREAKIELKAAYDRGEDIEQIMLDSRKEMQQLAQYKAELNQQLREMAKENPDMTTADMETMVEAANKMLEEKGIAPMNFGPLTKRKMLMMQHENK